MVIIFIFTNVKLITKNQNKLMKKTYTLLMALAIMTFVGIQSASAQLYINEFMASNDAAYPGPQGDYPDWIEIYNTSGEDIDLSGMYLTDNSDNLTKWQFPYGGVMLEAGGYLLVWCDEDQEQGALHTNFKLSSGGEFLAIVSPDGSTILDSITFPEQDADISYGRVAEELSLWDYMTREIYFC